MSPDQPRTRLPMPRTRIRQNILDNIVPVLVSSNVDEWDSGPVFGVGRDDLDVLGEDIFLG